jgi:hypothetical protein
MKIAIQYKYFGELSLSLTNIKINGSAIIHINFINFIVTSQDLFYELIMI